MSFEINILHLYPDLLNLYGDRGNIECMERRLEWREIKANITQCLVNDDIDLSCADIVFIGGGSDREQKIVCHKLLKWKLELIDYVNHDGVLVAVCGGYQLLGNYYKTYDEEIKGLGMLNIYTMSRPGRLTGNVILRSDFCECPIVGFENHAGRTYIGNHTPFAKVICGYGNDGISGYEGVKYKNVLATYLHGPLLPKNPQLCDSILTSALKKKYHQFEGLSVLNDCLEFKANKYIQERFTK